MGRTNQRRPCGCGEGSGAPGGLQGDTPGSPGSSSHMWCRMRGRESVQGGRATDHLRHDGDVLPAKCSLAGVSDLVSGGGGTVRISAPGSHPRG